MKRLVSLVVLVGALFGASPAFAVDEPVPGPLDLPVDQIDDAAHPEVTVTVTVPRELVGLDLQPSDFFISENELARSVDVRRLPSEELGVVLVLDTSGSMRGEPLLAAKRAVESFLLSMPAGVDVALVSFGDTAQVEAPFTKDYTAILDAVAPLEAVGETALYDAVALGSGLFGATDASRKAMILLSDGGDTVSSIELDDALIELIDAGPRFIAVELESSENDSVTLARLGAASGGSIVPASDPAALTQIYEATASDLVNQYELTFTSQAEGIVDLVVAVRRGGFAAVAESQIVFPDLPVVDLSDPEPEGPAAPEPIFVPAPPVVAVDVPWIASTPGLIVAAVAVFGALALTFVLMVPTRTGGLAFFGLVGNRVRRGSSRFSGIASTATMLVEEAVTRGHGDRRLRVLLDRAGLRLRIGEFLVLIIAIALVAFAAVYSFFGVLFGALAALVSIGLVVVIIDAVGQRRRDKFRSQLPDTLQLIAGSLRAGFGLNTAIGAVADEQEDPTAMEFARLLVEVQLGRTVEDALRSAATRVQSEDLPWVADAIEIHRETGGDIADLLDGIGATVRERERVRGQIRSLSAEGRISGLILVLMPFFLAGVTYLTAPDYLGELTASTAGRWMIAVGAFNMIVGVVWIRRIIRLKY
jgi:tight adherence protein B